MELLLGVDLGTTGAKALLITKRGEILAQHTEAYPLYHPRPGWAEQHAEDWWEAVIHSIRAVLGQPDVQSKQVVALALSGQMHGSVFLDKEGAVIRPPILWCDTRTTAQCREITDWVGEPRLLKLVGNPALEGFTAPKVLWLQENEPGNYRKMKTLLLPKDYIVWRLTGRRITDVSDAAGTLLFDVHKRRWSRELLELLKIDPTILPEVLESADVVGPITSEAARLTGLSQGVHVVAGGADNACSAVGNGIVEEGVVSSSIGSSGVILAHTESPKQDPFGRLHTFNHAVPGKWYLMGVMLAAGLSLKWYKETFGDLETQLAEQAGVTPYSLLDQEAEHAPLGCEGLIFLPYLNGERTPHRDARARGAFIGVSQRHDRKHFVRAILEGVAFGLRDSLELVRGLGVPVKEVRLTGGGAASTLWSQIQAEVFGVPASVVEKEEGPAFGAALLAGVGVGMYLDVLEAIQETVRIARYVEPCAEHVEQYRELYELFKPIYSRLKGTFADLHAFVESTYARG
ncbi:xylulokinase [Candidatus Bipolaricaulota bacterium]|nr:xylulokinase [Candidatus Bipolaricaulota bacterium]